MNEVNKPPMQFKTNATTKIVPIILSPPNPRSASSPSSARIVVRILFIDASPVKKD